MEEKPCPRCQRGSEGTFARTSCEGTSSHRSTTARTTCTIDTNKAMWVSHKQKMIIYRTTNHHCVTTQTRIPGPIEYLTAPCAVMQRARRGQWPIRKRRGFRGTKTLDDPIEVLLEVINNIAHVFLCPGHGAARSALWCLRHALRLLVEQIEWTPRLLLRRWRWR